MSASHVFRSVVSGLVTAVAVFVGVIISWQVATRTSEPAREVTESALSLISSPGPTPPFPPPLPGAPPETVLLVRDDQNDGVWEETLIIQNGAQRTLDLPEDTRRSITPVTDGGRIYVVTNPEGRTTSPPAQMLVALSLTDDSATLISGATPLVTPGELFAGPNANVIAFYLDSKSALTELWTLDAQTGTKRLSLERLGKRAAGPFWAPDGGFLVIDGGTLLRGSPQRTGGDILPVRRAWRDVPSGQTVIPSPGGSQVIYVVQERGEAVFHLRVWDLLEGREREVMTFPGGPVQLLGWSAGGALLAVAGSDEVTLWEIRKDAQAAHSLGAGVSSVTLSGDGFAVALLRQTPNGVTLETIDASTKKPLSSLKVSDVSAASLSPSPAVARPVSRRPSSQPYRIVQYLRSASAPVSSVADGTARASSLAQEDVVRYSMERIRDIADAPAAEPVTAERVWFTKTPDTVFVDYRVGTLLWRRLLRLTSVGGKPTAHEVLGVFAPAAGEWALTKGASIPDPRPTLLYEFEPDMERWVRKDVTEDIQP